MRFMILLRADADAPPSLLTGLASYHEALKKAGALLDGAGLKPSAAGWRVQHAGGRQSVVDGPFAEARELVAGYTVIDVKSREEALEWSRRFPFARSAGGTAVVEVRPLHELSDLGQGEGVEQPGEVGLQ